MFGSTMVAALYDLSHLSFQNDVLARLRASYMSVLV